MNILVDSLPTALEIDGISYPINPDFRGCIRTIAAFEDPQLTDLEKQTVMLQNLFTGDLPGNLVEALKQANWFLNGGIAVDGESGEDAPRLYSFSKDSNFIFAAFRQTHGIDLLTANLHWWAFLALFMDLGSETTFCSLIALRKRVKNGTATKEERASAREMGDLFDLPEIDTRTLDEREAEETFLKLVAKGQH